MDKQQQYKEIFLAEAEESLQQLNQQLTVLEKKPTDKKSIDTLFRITHTMKGNAAGLGYQGIADLSHTIEDLFGEVREQRLLLTPDIFTHLFKAIDVLEKLVNALQTDKKVAYKGIRTKLQVIIRRNNENLEEAPPSPKSAKKEASKEVQEVPKIEEIREKTEVLEEENQITFSDHIQVPVKKLDNLLNLVGELIIERDRLITQGKGKYSHNEFSRLYRITSDLQYSVMDVRLIQVGFLFQKFHRIIRDIAHQDHKKVDLKLSGTETEIDRNILQTISDSLIHLMRNAIGHGIESPAERKKHKKNEVGTIELKSYNENDMVTIEITDDGKGIDPNVIKRKAIEKGLVSEAIAHKMNENEIIHFIFEPGFSSMDTITAVSGRGVGMDVVKKAIDGIGGNIHVQTEIGKGTTFKMILPSSMAVKGTLLFELNAMEYAIPLTHTEAVLSLKKRDIHKVGKGLVASHLDRNINIVFLHDLFEDSVTINEQVPEFHHSFHQLEDDTSLDIVICSYNNKEVGFVVDKLLQQKEIVEKPLMKPVDQVKFISGVTILGTGNVCLVLNIAAIMNYIYKNQIRAEIAS